MSKISILANWSCSIDSGKTIPYVMAKPYNNNMVNGHSSNWNGFETTTGSNIPKSNIIVYWNRDYYSVNRNETDYITINMGEASNQYKFKRLDNALNWYALYDSDINLSDWIKDCIVPIEKKQAIFIPYKNLTSINGNYDTGNSIYALDPKKDVKIFMDMLVRFTKKRTYDNAKPIIGIKSGVVNTITPISTGSKKQKFRTTDAQIMIKGGAPISSYEYNTGKEYLNTYTKTLNKIRDDNNTWCVRSDDSNNFLRSMAEITGNNYWNTGSNTLSGARYTYYGNSDLNKLSGAINTKITRKCFSAGDYYYTQYHIDTSLLDLLGTYSNDRIKNSTYNYVYVTMPTLSLRCGLIKDASNDNAFVKYDDGFTILDNSIQFYQE